MQLSGRNYTLCVRRSGRIRHGSGLSAGHRISGALHENYRTAIEEIYATDTQVISVDTNSGMNGTTSEHHPNAIPCPPWLDMAVIDVTSD